MSEPEPESEWNLAEIKTVAFAIMPHQGYLNLSAKVALDAAKPIVIDHLREDAVERVAKALYHDSWGDDGVMVPGWDSFSDLSAKSPYVWRAQVAVDAVLEVSHVRGDDPV